MSIDPQTYVSDKAAKTISPERKLIATGAHGQLVAITIPAGTETGEELQHGSDQSIFVAEGMGEAILNGHSESAGEHDAIFIPAGTVYKLKNSGAADLKLFVSYSPPAMAETTAPAPQSKGHFYAIARSASVTDQSDEQARRAFPGGIKWTSWKRPTLKKILFGTDFSPASDAALPHAISIARHYRSRLFVAHVVVPDVSGLIAPQLIDRIRSEFRATAAAKIEQLVRSSGAQDLNIEAVVAEGAVADVLFNLVDRNNIDLVVLGTHGRRGIRKMVLGSVAEEVFRLAPCPVLTVGPKAEDTASGPLQFENVVYPMELSGDVLSAAGYAISLAKEYGAELTFLNVIEESTMSRGERHWINVTAEHWFEDKIAPDLEVAHANFAQRFGDPASAILEFAAEKKADLIVMNIQATQPTSRGLAPSVAHRVVAEAVCPVLTVR